jgi:hypothetical protein
MYVARTLEGVSRGNSNRACAVCSRLSENKRVNNMGGKGISDGAGRRLISRIQSDVRTPK